MKNKEFKTALFILLIVSTLFAWQKRVGGNILLINDNGYVVKEGQYQSGAILAYNSPVKINGVLGKSVLSIRGSVIVSGKVRKNMISLASSVRIKRRSVILGNVLTLGGRFVVEPGSSARIFNFSFLARKIGVTTGFKIFIIYLSFVVLGFFFNFFFQNNFIFIGEYMKYRFGQTLTVGALSIPFMLLLTIVFSGTVIGFTFLPALFFIYIFFLFFSFYSGSLWFGERLMKIFTKRDYPYFEQFLGISAVFIVSLIPYLGLFFNLILLLAAMGATAKLKFGVRE